MRALITGITGFAGGFLAEHLLDCGDELLGVSRRGAWPNWAGDRLRNQVQIFPWDVGESARPENVRDVVVNFGPECIYHLAALSVPTDCGTTEPTRRAIETNLGGTQRVLDLAASLPHPPRFVFISTSHVYGKVSRETHVLDEQAPLHPHRAYGKTKLMAEDAVRHASEQHGLNTIIVRAFQHSGPRQEPRLMLPEWVEQVSRKSPRLHVRHLDTWVDLTDVRDVVRAYRLLAEHGEAGVAYNVGCGVPRRTGDIVSTLVRISGINAEIIELGPGPEKLDPIADIRRMQAATGWQPLIDLERTIGDTLEYWRVG